MVLEKIARIENTELGPEHYCSFGFNINLTYGSSGQGTGWYGLDTIDVLKAILKACGVDRWEMLKGRTVIALIEDNKVVGFKPLPTEPGTEMFIKDCYDDDGE